MQDNKTVIGLYSEYIKLRLVKVSGKNKIKHLANYIINIVNGIYNLNKLNEIIINQNGFHAFWP